MSGKFNSLGELTTDKITEGECDHIILDPKNFTTDSWETIAEAVRDGSTDKYKTGDYLFCQANCAVGISPAFRIG